MENMDEFKISDEARARMTDPEIINEALSKGKTFQEILGYTAETMEKFYSAAYKLYQEQRYEDASDAFVFLTSLNPHVHNYWLGLGMCEHMTEEYHGALMAYGMAVMTDIRNPIPHYHSASCYKALEDIDSALASIDLALVYAGEKEEHSRLKQRALAAKTLLQKKR